MSTIQYFLVSIVVLYFLSRFLIKRRRRNLFNLAYNLTLNGHTINAIKVYDRLIKLSPKNFVYYNNRGNGYMYLGDLEKARSDFNKSIELESDLLDNHMAYDNIERLEIQVKADLS